MDDSLRNLDLHAELVEVTRQAFGHRGVSMSGFDYAVRAIELADSDPTPMQLYQVTACLDTFAACHAVVYGLEQRRQRLENEARWLDDGGRA